MRVTKVVVLLIFGQLSLASEKIQYVPGEIIIKLKGQKSFNKLQEKYGKRALEKLKWDFGDYALVKVARKALKKHLDLLNNDENVFYAEPNYTYHAIGKKGTAQVNDPRFSKLWGLNNTGGNEPRSSSGNSSNQGVKGADINALKAWKLSKGDKNIVIAVIDTGIDYKHEDLKDNMWVNTAELNGSPGVDDDGNGHIDDIYGHDFANNDGDPMDGNGHGTHCAGTIGAVHDNGKGVAGVMGKVSLMGVKFLTDQGSGSAVGAVSAINYATKMRVDIMSNSWGGGGYSEALKDAIMAAKSKGIVFIAAAGNSQSDNNSVPHYPSNYEVDNVISVAAHNYSDRLASFSCYGSKTVHVAAPGRNILSTTPDNSYDVYSGTSMATPHVSGVVGLYLAHRGKTSPRKLRQKLMNSANYVGSIGRKLISGGRVDAYNFLNDHYPARPERPDPSQWLTMPIAKLESEHPYANNQEREDTVHIPGARFIRLILNKINLEKGYDFLDLFDSKGELIERITGDSQNVYSEYISGDKLILKFNSDNSIIKWGYLIEEAQYIP